MTLTCCNCIPQRYLVAALCFIMMLVSVGYRAVFALMATHISSFNSTGNVSAAHEEKSIFPHCTTTGTSRDKKVNWSGSTVSLFHTAFFAGQFVTSIPAGALVMKCSPKLVFGIALLTLSILQLLLPVVTDVHVWLMYIIRTVQGILEATSIPAMNAVISAWTPANQKARLMSVAYAGVYLSPAVAMFAAGATTCYVSWDSIMYIYGSIGIAWCLPWMLMITSSPAKHPKCIDKEQLEPQPNDVPHFVTPVPNRRVPWCKFFTSLPVLSIWMAAFCQNFMFALLVTEVQQYYKDVYKLPASVNGLLSGLPQIFMAAFILSGAFIFDTFVKRGILSVTNTRKLAQCSGFGIQGACTFAIGFVDDHIVACVLLSVGAAFGGFSMSGYQTNILDLAPDYAGPLTGIVRTGMLGSVISSTLAAQLTGSSHSLVDWQHLFIIAGSVHLAGVVFYGIFASGNLQSWAQAEVSKDTNASTENANEIYFVNEACDITSEININLEHNSQERDNTIESIYEGCSHGYGNNDLVTDNESDVVKVKL